MKRNPRVFPFRAAAIDAGSNAIRFAAAAFETSRRTTPLDFQRAPVRLGRDVFRDGRLSEAAMAAAADAFVGFRERMERLGIRGYRAVATSAVREAANAGVLLERIRERTGLEVDPIDPAEEARLAHLAVRDRVPMGTGTWLLGDLGGGSLEVSLATRARIVWTTSRTLGAVRLVEALTTHPEDLPRLKDLVAHHLPVSLIPTRARPAGCIATGGGIEALARLAGPSVGPGKVPAVPVADLLRLAADLHRMPLERRIHDLGLSPDRADVIVPAALVYARLADLAQAELILAPGVGVTGGILLDIRARLRQP